MAEMRIYKRSEWGAQYRDGVGTRSLPAVYGFFHHPVSATAGPNATLAQDMARIRDVERVGNARFGTMSYSYLITESGRIFQGLSDNRIGAHTSGYNTNGLAISFVGNYEANQPNQKMLDAAAWLIADLERRGVITKTAVWRGHYQVAATACPGKYLKPHLPGIVLAARISPPKEEPAVSETPYWNIFAVFPDEERARTFGAWCQANGIATTRSGVAQVAHGNDAKSRAAEAEAERLGAVCPFGRIYTTKDSWRHVSVRTPLKPLAALPTEPKTWVLAEQTTDRIVLSVR
jgi:N-acetylmuramoyl-L-alanine amidase